MQLEQALAAVGGLEWAKKLPEQLETEVGSGRYALPPAQAQQVVLARLVLLDPHTLILNKATSMLDPRVARDLEFSLSAVLLGRTVVAITHRLHTAHDADRVVVVTDGLITEIVSHDDLVAQVASTQPYDTAGSKPKNIEGGALRLLEPHHPDQAV